MAKQSMPKGICQRTKMEVLGYFPGGIEQAESYHFPTHYGFVESYSRKENRMIVKAYPYKNWRERIEVAMNNAGY